MRISVDVVKKLTLWRLVTMSFVHDSPVSRETSLQIGEQQLLKFQQCLLAKITGTYQM